MIGSDLVLEVLMHLKCGMMFQKSVEKCSGPVEYCRSVMAPCVLIAEGGETLHYCRYMVNTHPL